jgi:hypothetical protein
MTKNMLFASDGVKPNYCMKAKLQANNFLCGGYFQPHFFERKVSRQSQSWREKNQKKIRPVSKIRAPLGARAYP